MFQFPLKASFPNALVASLVESRAYHEQDRLGTSGEKDGGVEVEVGVGRG